MFQLEEREGNNSHWSLCRASQTVQTIDRIPTEKEAVTLAKKYVSEINLENALTAEEKISSFDAYFMDKKGAFLGNLDNKDVYLKDKDKNIVKDENYYLLTNKIAVRIKKMLKS